jgi:hypothetical protein
MNTAPPTERGCTHVAIGQKCYFVGCPNAGTPAELLERSCGWWGEGRGACLLKYEHKGTTPARKMDGCCLSRSRDWPLLSKPKGAPPNRRRAVAA